MSVIRVLPEKVALQIAAGEVIERPASVVRELLDNSIDAGADMITVRIEKGGGRLIKVSDNGGGMGSDDLLLCIERHATSKIHSISDLSAIKSLGFRGEALPSISSVSRMEITSRQGGELVGHRLKVHGGKLISMEETGAPPGTVVLVEDLFFNTPARRKFLRTLKTETDHIVDAVSRIALPFTHIHFRLDENERTVLNLPASKELPDRIAELLGRHVAVSMEETVQENDRLGIRAYLASPDQSRNRGDRIFIYVNRRNVKERLITRALMEGYGSRLMKGRYPQAVILLDIDPAEADFNVHPAKQEVRFSNGRHVYDSVLTAVMNGLGRRMQPLMDERPRTFPVPVKTAPPVQNSMPGPEWRYTIREPPAGPENRVGERPFGYGPARIIGQLKNTYILCECEQGFVMIDQHAAHERVLFEGLKQAYQRSSPEMQRLLIPFTLEVSPGDRRVLEERLELLGAVGFDIEHFGGDTFILRSVPSILADAGWDRFVMDIIPVLQEQSPDRGSEQTMDRILAAMACHGAIRAGQRLSEEEMNTLLSQLEELETPTHCPHGRPVSRSFTLYEIEKMFKRIL
jgi:DNA mismatch repair protein MutL